MCSLLIVEEKYECNAATIYGNDTIVKKKKSFELRTAVEISLYSTISLAGTRNIVYAYVCKVSCIFDSGSIHAMATFFESHIPAWYKK